MTVTGTKPKNYLDQCPRPELTDLIFTRHAIDRMLDMAVEGEEVRKVFTAPRFGYWSRKHEAWVLESGRLTVGYREAADHPGKWAVLTVLWRTDAEWARDAAIAPLPKGRYVR